jgi:hypothetical protein
VTLSGGLAVSGGLTVSGGLHLGFVKRTCDDPWGQAHDFPNGFACFCNVGEEAISGYVDCDATGHEIEQGIGSPTVAVVSNKVKGYGWETITPEQSGWAGRCMGPYQSSYEMFTPRYIEVICASMQFDSGTGDPGFQNIPWPNH